MLKQWSALYLLGCHLFAVVMTARSGLWLLTLRAAVRRAINCNCTDKTYPQYMLCDASLRHPVELDRVLRTTCCSDRVGTADRFKVEPRKCAR